MAQALTPVRSSTGQRLPYALGWFVQDYQGLRIQWQHGHWTTFSGLYLKIPDKALTLIVLANSGATIDPLPLNLMSFSLTSTPM